MSLSWWQWVAMVVLAVVLIVGSLWASVEDGWLPWGWCGIPLVLIAGLLVVMVPIWNDQQAAWEQWCQDNGGRVTDTTNTTVVSTGTGVGVGSSTTYYCITADGRLLDVRSP